MSYDVNQGNIFGRIGAGIGKGLSEQIPKEVERSRLASGLENLNKQNIQDPFEFFTKALSIPGINPQMVQSLAELSKQRLQARALENIGGEGSSFSIPNTMPSENANVSNESPSITTREPIEATVRPFIRRDPETLLKDAQKTFSENPAFFKYDVNSAIDFERNKDIDREMRSKSLQEQRRTQQDVQKTVITDLGEQHTKLGGLIPSPVYNKLEDKAIKAVLPKDEGGEGLTEQQAIKKYAKEMDQISKDYSLIDTLGFFELRKKDPKDVKKNLERIQKDIAARDEEEFFAKRLQEKVNLSPYIAFDLAYPVTNTPAVESYIQNLPALPPAGPMPPKSKRITQDQLNQELSSRMSRKSGPIAIANALSQKNYDSDAFLDYLEENKDRLLTPEQALQLKEAKRFIPSLSDLYFNSYIRD